MFLCTHPQSAEQETESYCGEGRGGNLCLLFSLDLAIVFHFYPMFCSLNRRRRRRRTRRGRRKKKERKKKKKKKKKKRKEKKRRKEGRKEGGKEEQK